MQRKFLINLGILLFLNLLVKPIWIFGIDLHVQNLVGASEFGFYFSILNFSILFNILLDFGITNFNNRNIAQNNQLLKKHFSGIMGLRLLLGVLYFVVVLISGLIVGYSDRYIKFLVLLCINQFLSSMILYLRSNISGLLFFKVDSMLSVLDRFLMILICGVLLWGGFTNHTFKIEWFVYAQMASYALTALAAFLFVVKKAKFERFTWNWRFSLLILKQSLPFSILTLLMSFYNRIDSVMLERILPVSIAKTEAGIYAGAFRLLDAITMFAYLFSVILLPTFSRMLKQKENVAWLVKLSSALLFSFSFTLAVGLSFNSEPIMQLLYKANITETHTVFSYLILSFIPLSTIYVFGTLLTANGNLKQLIFIALSVMIVNILLNAILIPRYLAVGSAWTSLISQSIAAILHMIVAQKVFKFKPDTSFLIRFGSFFCIVVVLGYFSTQLPLDWKISFALMLFASLIMGFVLKLYDLKGFFKLVKPK